ncbi:outer membrane beta-barrel protein [Neolewinella lacunae]|uniref:PorT family protein n=1 Tax=Neolewinella lacunae TaxID=1517758 RepID=A0A923T8X8_9BACT|nr:outer membrane beta-barrel protein [Neolewinella lacunae]MBC6994453.1 PorT family protein [Neolewinella lacunae]MDN3634250.1 outer membrane beta-barrel protein [Neolewinella lacunae]
MLRFLLPFLLAGTAVAGQSADSTAVRRLDVGLSYAYWQHEVDFTPSAEVEALPGTTYGLALRYFDNRVVGFQAELNYVNAGWRETLDTNFTSLYERRTEYLELLLLTQLRIGRGVVQPILQAGPYFSVPLAEEESIPAEYVPGDGVLPEYYGFAFPFRLNYGLQAALGVNVALGPLTLQLEGRYLTGFNDVVKTGTTTAVISRRRGFGGRVGVLYRF